MATQQPIHKLDLLISLYIFCILIAELMGQKTFPLATIGSFHLNASVAVFAIPLVYTINDAITEVYGKARARSVIRSGLWMIVLLILFSAFATWLPASTRFAPTEAAYEAIFTVSIRISIASLLSFALAEFLDVYIFSVLRQKLEGRVLWFRNIASNAVSEFVDTTVFMTLAFYALNQPFNDNFHFLLSLTLPYWLLKCAMSVIETPFVYACVQWLRKEEVA